jgi:anti-sigma28 factor (negative regulator of flagellin synthesis)
MAVAAKPRAVEPGGGFGGAGLVSEGREAARRMAAEPPVDSSRVSALREAIAGGQYRVDPERIADAMLRSEPGLLRR